MTTPSDCATMVSGDGLHRDGGNPGSIRAPNRSRQRPPMETLERRGWLLTVGTIAFIAVMSRCGMTKPKGRPEKATPEPIDTSRAAEEIRRDTLRLCTLIGEVCPKGRRLEAALGSIRAGARLAIEELQAKQTLLAGTGDGAAVRS